MAIDVKERNEEEELDLMKEFSKLIMDNIDVFKRLAEKQEVCMQVEETKVLRQIIGSIEDYDNGGISDFLLIQDVLSYLPELHQLQEYIESLETELEETNEELYEAESYYDALYEDYMNFQDEMMTEDE